MCAACNAHLIFIDLTYLKILGNDYKLQMFSVCNFYLSSYNYLFFVSPNIFPGTFLRTL